MASSRATIFAAVISSCCADINAAWLQETVDLDSPGLSLLQLRLASTLAGAGGAEAATAVDAQTTEEEERALPWPHAEAVTQRALPWASAHSQDPISRVLPWMAKPQKEEALLDTTKAENDADFDGDFVDTSSISSLASGCHFTDPVVGVSPGSYNNIMHDVKTLAQCQAACDSEATCSAIVFKATRSLCVTLPREYDSGFKPRSRGPVVSNRICKASSHGASDKMAVDKMAVDEMAVDEMAVNEVPACPFSTAIRGHSPGPDFKDHYSVATLADCQKLCALDVACLSVVHRKGQEKCLLLSRLYNENYEVAMDDDDAVVSNKVCGQ